MCSKVYVYSQNIIINENYLFDYYNFIGYLEFVLICYIIAQSLTMKFITGTWTLLRGQGRHDRESRDMLQQQQQQQQQICLQF